MNVYQYSIQVFISIFISFIYVKMCDNYKNDVSLFSQAKLW